MKRSIILKHFLLILLSVSMALGCMVLSADAVSVSDFTDVSSSQWYYDAVSFAVSEGLFNGTTDTTFEPYGIMSRRMFITVLGRYAGVDPDDWLGGTVTGSAVRLREGPGTSYDIITTMDKYTSVTILDISGDWYKVRCGSYTGYVSGDYLSPDYHAFSDVDYGDYCAGYAIWGYEKGIVNGLDGSETFGPQYYVSREEICCMLDRYIDYAGLTYEADTSVTVFSDQSSIHSWAAESVAAMQSYGIVMGEKEGDGYQFRPRDYAARAEVAIMFMRLHDNAVSATPAPGETTAPTPTATPIPEDKATFLSSTIAIPADTIRVGLYTSASSVTLYNQSGSSFEYGYFNTAREFVSSGVISANSITVTTDGSTFTVKNSSGTVVHTSTGNFAVHPVSNSKALTKVNGGNRYFGDFELRQSSTTGRIILVNYVDIEDYVKGVIPYEYGTSWPAETLKAAAITARNFAMSYDWSIYSAKGYDISSTVQVYSGRGSSYSNSYFSATDAAVDATKNVYLTYASNGTNRLCETYYFSSSGGATEDSAHIWGGSYSYLIGKIDPYEQAASSLATYYTYTITNTRTGSRMTALANSLGLSTLAPDGIKIETYPDTGNVKRIVLTDERGKTATISQTTSFDRWDFLTAFGFTAYSYRYQVSYNEAADTFTCTRYGWGHNVGLSQWGAYAMARYYNKDYQDILGFYYDGTHLQYGAN